jgi:hypothetical protein
MSHGVRPAAGLFAEPRPVTALGDLFANIWQVSYVTTDLDRGIQALRERFGIEHCIEVPTAEATFLKGDEPVEWNARIAMSARGGLIVELVEGVSGEVEFYRRFLPSDGSFGLRLHHLASFIPTGDEAWASLGELLAEQGLRVDYTVLIPDRVRAGYVDMTADLGHFLEVCQLEQADIEFFSGLVAQSA